MITPCKKCSHKTVLASRCLSRFTVDAEPYESGFIETPETIEKGEEILTDVQVGIHWCEKCQKISDAWIEKP